MPTRREKLEAVAEIAGELRGLQKRYFKGERDLLDDCKTLERKLDYALEQLDDMQTTMFTDPS